MPRANRYFVPGYVWHITHRCHRKVFLLKFGKCSGQTLSMGSLTYDECLIEAYRKESILRDSQLFAATRRYTRRDLAGATLSLYSRLLKYSQARSATPPCEVS